MALLVGHSLTEIRRSIQHGHSQLTIAGLLGSPLPSDLVKAESTDDGRPIPRCVKTAERVEGVDNRLSVMIRVLLWPAHFFHVDSVTKLRHGMKVRCGLDPTNGDHDDVARQLISLLCHPPDKATSHLCTERRIWKE